MKQSFVLAIFFIVLSAKVAASVDSILQGYENKYSKEELASKNQTTGFNYFHHMCEFLLKDKKWSTRSISDRNIIRARVVREYNQYIDSRIQYGFRGDKDVESGYDLYKNLKTNAKCVEKHLED